MKNTLKYMTIAVLFAGTAQFAQAHCQVPCGIYDDMVRIQLMEEHVTTIAKAMKQIESGLNQNQTVRWITNKEKHAEELTDIATYYFLTQRIKPTTENYHQKLEKLHLIMIHSMKAKQSTDTAQTDKLTKLIHEFAELYTGKKLSHKH